VLAVDVGERDMRVNLGNETELYMLAAALDCDIVDLYIAVAMVGDKLEAVTKYLEKISQQQAPVPQTPLAALH
jgi:hypothetical protein